MLYDLPRDATRLQPIGSHRPGSVLTLVDSIYICDLTDVHAVSITVGKHQLLSVQVNQRKRTKHARIARRQFQS